MAAKEIKKESIETVEPIGKRVVIRKDEDKKETKGGIQLPDNIEIPTITGRIVSVSAEVEISSELPLRQYDKVLFNPKGAIPVDFEGDNRLFVVDVLVAVPRDDVRSRRLVLDLVEVLLDAGDGDCVVLRVDQTGQEEKPQSEAECKAAGPPAIVGAHPYSFRSAVAGLPPAASTVEPGAHAWTSTGRGSPAGSGSTRAEA